jgi:C4-type Zn-finger protein
MTSCPRCRADHSHCCKQWKGVQSGKIVWTIWHCQRCSFSWRDTEPARSIDYAARETFSRVDPDRPEKYGQNIPPARVRD